jgi:cytosine deaminase
MAGRDDVADLWEMLTEANAEVVGASGYGLREGTEGSLVVYDGPDAFNALRTRAPRTLVLRAGDEVARTEPAATTVHRDDGPSAVDFHR